MSHRGVKSVLLIKESKDPASNAGTVYGNKDFKGTATLLQLSDSFSCTNQTLGKPGSYKLVNNEEVKSNCTFYSKGDCISPALLTSYGGQSDVSTFGADVLSYWCELVSR